jgi:hypothetical protein
MLKPDHDYIRQRDALIPEAEKKANKRFGEKAPGTTGKANEKYAKDWTGCFFREMDRLWRRKEASVKTCQAES